MKKLFSFLLTLLFATSMFAVENVEIVASADIQRWGGAGDMYFDINAKDQNDQIWNLSLNPSTTLPSDGLYPWGMILTEADMDWDFTELKRGYTMPTGDVTNLKFCAKLGDGGVQMYELVYDATYGGVEYHIHAVHNVPEGTSLFEEAPALVADYDVEATGWKDESSTGDVYFSVYGKSAEGNWTFNLDPDDSSFATWSWGETYKNTNFDFDCCTKVASSPVGTGKMSEVKTFTMTQDASGNIAYLEAWFVWKEKLIHLHYGEAPQPEEEGDVELISYDMKDLTTDKKGGTDIYIDNFTAKDSKGRTWSFCFDPKATGPNYPWGTTMTLADMDPDPNYTYVKLDGTALAMKSLSLFMDLNDDNGNPYLEATIEATLGEQEYHIHVTANKPAPATEIVATTMTEGSENGQAELKFTDAAGNTVTIDFKEPVIYFDQVYNYTSKLDSITAILTRYNGGMEAMNPGAAYNCKAKFLVTKDAENVITVALSYTTNLDKKYKLSYTGAYSGSKITYPVVAPDTIAVAIDTENAEWVDASRESGAWTVTYASKVAGDVTSGMLSFVDYSGNFVRSYSSEEMLMLMPYVMLYNETYQDGTELTVTETQDIAIATNVAADTVLLTGTMVAINEDSLIYKITLHIVGAYPKVAGKEYDNEVADFDGTETGTFYITSIQYDELWEQTTYTAYTSDSAYMAKIVINDGEGTTPGGFDPLAVSEGVHPVSDDFSAPGVCVGGAYYTNPMGTNIDGSVIAKLDADGNVETPLWLFTQGLVLVQGEGENLIIMVNAANSYGKLISADLMMPKSPATAVETIKNEQKAAKLLRNGALIIRKGEAEYNVLGATLK